MNEEIDIIELLKRVKEGKAPKRILVNRTEYFFDKEKEEIGSIYTNPNDDFFGDELITLDTKIKILDKPIIERLIINPEDNFHHQIFLIENKTNEIIDYINKNNKE